MPIRLQKKRDNQRFEQLKAPPTVGGELRAHCDPNEIVKNRLHRPPDARHLDSLPLTLDSVVVSMR